MAVLKKIKASTLMETLVATVLIVVVFMLASMILNHLFSNTIKNNTADIDAYINELKYLYLNDQLSLPFHEDYKQWEVSVQFNNNNQNVSFEATHLSTNQNILTEIVAK